MFLSYLDSLAAWAIFDLRVRKKNTFFSSTECLFVSAHDDETKKTYTFINWRQSFDYQMSLAWCVCTLTKGKSARKSCVHVWLLDLEICHAPKASKTCSCGAGGFILSPPAPIKRFWQLFFSLSFYVWERKKWRHEWNRVELNWVGSNRIELNWVQLNLECESIERESTERAQLWVVMMAPTRKTDQFNTFNCNLVVKFVVVVVVGSSKSGSLAKVWCESWW